MGLPSTDRKVFHPSDMVALAAGHLFGVTQLGLQSFGASVGYTF